MLDPLTYTPLPPFAATAGKRDAKVVLVGEAFGENEDQLRCPFVGWSGYELSRMVYEAGLVEERPLAPEQYSSLMLMDWWNRQDLFLTNVFAFRPPENKLNSICGKKALVGAGYKHESIGKEGYVLPKYLHELDRLRKELASYERTCIIALGAKAAWALLGQAKITALRGVAAIARLDSNTSVKVIPTYHPAGILRNWSWRSIALADMMKVAQREKFFSEVRRPERTVIVNPTITDVREWFKKPSLGLGVDTETKNRQIEMVGFARSRSDAIVIPLVDMSRPDRCYWSETDELEVWRIMQHTLENASIPKVFQNGLYDLQYFVRRSPVRPRNCAEDTMLLSHALFPELPKGLGFLGSIYSNEASWKLWRGKTQEEFKRDE